MHKDRIICNALIEHHYRMATYDVRDEEYLKRLDAAIREYRRKVRKKENGRTWWRSLLVAVKLRRVDSFCPNCWSRYKGKQCHRCKPQARYFYTTEQGESKPIARVRSEFARYPSALD